MDNAVVSETCCLSAEYLMFLEVGTRVGNLVSFRISLSEQPVAYTTPGTMVQRSLARNSSGANEGLEGIPYNAQYGETPLKKRKRKDIGKEKGRDNCHAFLSGVLPILCILWSTLQALTCSRGIPCKGKPF